MKKLAALIIIASMFLMGCVTTSQNNSDSGTGPVIELYGPANFDIASDGIYFNSGKIIEIKAEYEFGEAGYINLEMDDLRREINEVKMTIVAAIDLGDGYTTKNIFFGIVKFVDGKAALASNPFDGNIISFTITELDITYTDGNVVNAERFSESQMSGIFDGSGVTWASEWAMISDAGIVWHTIGENSSVDFRDNQIFVINGDTGEEILIATIMDISYEIPEGGGFLFNYTVFRESGLMWMIDISYKFLGESDTWLETNIHSKFFYGAPEELHYEFVYDGVDAVTIHMEEGKRGRPYTGEYIISSIEVFLDNPEVVLMYNNPAID